MPDGRLLNVAQESGTLHVEGGIDPRTEKPTFDMKVNLEKLQLKSLNDFTRAYANVDIERGTLDMHGKVQGG